MQARAISGPSSPPRCPASPAGPHLRCCSPGLLPVAQARSAASLPEPGFSPAAPPGPVACPLSSRSPPLLHQRRDAPAAGSQAGALQCPKPQTRGPRVPRLSAGPAGPPGHLGTLSASSRRLADPLLGLDGSKFGVPEKDRKAEVEWVGGRRDRGRVEPLETRNGSPAHRPGPGFESRRS